MAAEAEAAREARAMAAEAEVPRVEAVRESRVKVCIELWQPKQKQLGRLELRYV